MNKNTNSEWGAGRVPAPFSGASSSGVGSFSLPSLPSLYASYQSLGDAGSAGSGERVAWQAPVTPLWSRRKALCAQQVAWNLLRPCHRRPRPIQMTLDQLVSSLPLECADRRSVRDASSVQMVIALSGQSLQISTAVLPHIQGAGWGGTLTCP